MNAIDLPIACSLTTAELQERRSKVLQKVTAARMDSQELDNGYVYRFPSDGTWITEIATLVSLERECCPFLRFRITVEPGQGNILLEITGPAGTKEFLADIFI
jgi:hypothetical protein